MRFGKPFIRRSAAIFAAFVMSCSVINGGAAFAEESQNSAYSSDSRILTDPSAFALEITPSEGPFAGQNKVDIKGATPGFVQLAAGYYSALGVTNGGLMYGWGQNTMGWLGNGTTTNTITPTQVVTDGALEGVALTKVAIRYQHTLALSEDGRVFAWGQNQHGQLGDGTTTNSAVPVEVKRGQIPDGVKLIDIGAGANWSAALGDDGQVYVWGLNEDDAGNLGLGTGNLDSSRTPVPIKEVPGEKFIQLAVGLPSAAAVTESGKVYTWGWSNLLGNGTPIVGQVKDQRSLVPVQAIFPEDVKITHVELPASRAYANSAFALALDDRGRVWSWGLNNWGQLGNGTTTASPVPGLVQGLEGKTVKQIANSGRTAMALTEDNELYVWGSNNTGQLGIGPANASTKQTRAIRTNQSGVLDGVQITYIAGATGTMYALGEDGVIYSWGESQYGAAGNGGTVTTGSPGFGPRYGSLSYIDFHKTKIFPGDSADSISQRYVESSDGDMTEVTDVPVPPYPGGKPANTNEVEVDVTGAFKLFAGTKDTGETASWPIGKYTYTDRLGLQWGDGSSFASPQWSGSPKVGSQVEYTFTGVNTGTLPLEALDVTVENFSGSNGIPKFTCSPDPVLKDEKFTCTASYVLSETDLASGSLDLTGHLKGSYGNETVSTEEDPREVKVPLSPKAGLTLNKTVSTPEVFAKGKTITYSFKIQNTGDVSVKNLEIIEEEFGGSGVIGQISCPGGYPIPSLGIEDTVSCEADYTLTQTDVDNGGFSNTAIVTGLYMADNSGKVKSNESTAQLSGQSKPELDFEVYSDFNCDQMDPSDPQVCKNWKAGESVNFLLKVTNNGLVSLDNVQVSPVAFNGAGALSQLSCTPSLGSKLAPGESMLCEAPYVLHQDDVDGLAGALTLAGVAEGTFKDTTVTGEDVHDLSKTPIKAIGLVKSQSISHDDPWKVGAQNTYSLTMTNLGTATLTDVTLVDDNFTGSNGLPMLDCDPGATGTAGGANVASLAPGQEITCSFTYSLTQADVDKGIVQNHAVVSGTALNGSDEVTAEATAADWTGTATAVLGLEKTVATEPNPFKAGEQVVYTFTVTNQGSGTVSDIRVEDLGPKTGDAYGAGKWTGVSCVDGQDDFDGMINSLAPGESAACEATYTLTQQDADAAVIENYAEVNGTDPQGNPATPAFADANAGPGPEKQINNAQLTLSVADGQITDPKVGAEVTFQVEMENTGIVTVNDADLNLPEGFTASCTPSLPVILAPGEKAQCEVTAVLTSQDMVDAASLMLKTVGTGTYLGTDVLSNEDSGIAHWELPLTPGGGAGNGTGVGGNGGVLATTGAAVAGILAVAGVLVATGTGLRRKRK